MLDQVCTNNLIAIVAAVVVFSIDGALGLKVFRHGLDFHGSRIQELAPIMYHFSRREVSVTFIPFLLKQCGVSVDGSCSFFLLE